MDTTTLVLFLVAIALLPLGAQLLVDGAAALAVAAGISPLVVGLTIVALGTSSPELAAGLGAVLADSPDIAVGNVVGSNIFNILLILGLAALVVPVPVSQQVVRIEVPIMIAVSIAVFVFAIDGHIGRVEGLLLVVGGAAYVTFAVRRSRRETAEVRAEYEGEYGRRPRGWRLAFELGRIALGAAALVIAARWLVDGATAVARTLGIGEVVVGLTVVAIGTSLPEVATSVVASVRGEPDIAVGNAVGSNLFNLLIVLGIVSAVAPGGLAVTRSVVNFDLPVMVAVAVACLPIFFAGRLIGRWQGALFLAYLTAYLLYLVLDATDHDALGVLSTVMLAFVIPLTAVGLLVLVVREVRSPPSTS